MTLLCPHCEKPLGEEHDQAGCRRRMSRRFFFGLCVTPLLAKLAEKLPDDYRTVVILHYIEDLVLKAPWGLPPGCRTLSGHS